MVIITFIDLTRTTMVYRLGYMKKSGNRLSRCPDFVLNYKLSNFLESVHSYVRLTGGAIFYPSFSLQHHRWLLSEGIPDTQYSFRIRLKVTIKTAVYFRLH